MKVTAEQYGDICDVVYRTSHGWPLSSVLNDPYRRTSDPCRAAASLIIEILGFEFEDLPFTPELRKAMEDYLNRNP